MELELSRVGDGYAGMLSYSHGSVSLAENVPVQNIGYDYPEFAIPLGLSGSDQALFEGHVSLSGNEIAGQLLLTTSAADTAESLDLALVLKRVDQLDIIQCAASRREPQASAVAGRYRFREFAFQPNSAAVQPINLLDTLVTNGTHLDLSSHGQFIFAFEFVDGDRHFLGGEFGLTTNAVRIDGQRNDLATYNKLLLDEDYTLRRNSDSPKVLTAEIPKTVDPAGILRSL